MRACHRRGEDDGFTLIEVVIAMAVFTVFASVSLGLLVQSGGVTRTNLQRTAASNLATEQIQNARSQSVDDIPVGTTTRTQLVSNTTYTIVQTAKYLSSDSTSSVCDGSSAVLAYKLVTVKVTWPGSTALQTVRQDTLKSVGVSTSGQGSTTGALALSVTASTGVAVAGVTITLPDGTSTVTDDNGCAVFTGLAAGTYTATLNALGYVGLGNLQLTSKSGLGVSVGVLTRASVSYDTARSIVIVAGSPVTGAIVPSGIPVLLSSSVLSTPVAYAACPTTGTPTAGCATAPVGATNGVAKELYPSIYTVKLGACTDSPTQSQISANLTPASSDGSTVTVPMGAVTMAIKQGTGSTATTYAGTKTITLTHAGTGCTSGETYTVTGGNGTSIVVPYGTWTVSVPSGSGSGTVSTSVTVPDGTTLSRTGTATLTVVA